MAGRVLVFTGDGKGKTTAAVGMAIRAAGHGGRVRIIQFIKSDTRTGESECLTGFPSVEIEQAGLGFSPKPGSSTFRRHREAAAAGLARARETLRAGQFALVVLDEVISATAAGLVTEEDVMNVLEAASPKTDIVLTGRGAGQTLLEMADTVTEMRCVKHAYDAGLPAMKGVEF